MDKGGRRLGTKLKSLCSATNSIRVKPRPLSSRSNWGLSCCWLIEKRGRRIALRRGLTVTGLLGVLAEAKARGLISRCQPVLDDMIHVAGFWIGDDLRYRYLLALNEID